MRLTTPIHAVTFDAGGTLIEPWPSVGHVYAAVATEHKFKKIPPDALNQKFAAAWKAKRRFDYSRAAWRELVRATFAGLVSEPPSEEFFDALYRRFASAAVWRVFDDVVPALENLKGRKLKLAVISNWDGRLRPLLEQLELSRHFEATVISVEAGCTKPAPEIFRRAAALLGVPPTSILHVGDSAREDVAGAHAAGMQAVLVDRVLARAGDSAVGALTELAELLDSPVPDGRLD